MTSRYSDPAKLPSRLGAGGAGVPSFNVDQTPFPFFLPQFLIHSSFCALLFSKVHLVHTLFVPKSMYPITIIIVILRSCTTTTTLTGPSIATNGISFPIIPYLPSCLPKVCHRPYHRPYHRTAWVMAVSEVLFASSLPCKPIRRHMTNFQSNPKKKP